jgi:predicted DCC family thiol-disulfide oxidoreductase YuxK
MGIMDNFRETDPIGTSGLVIFDGSCGACSAFIGENKTFFEKHGFSVAPLQEAWVRDVAGLSEETLLQAIHLYKPDGDVVKGIDIFQHVASKVWWLRPLNLLLSIPILKPLFALIYNTIAQRRRSISRFCGLQSKAIYK